MLNARRQRFAQEYVIDLNATQAAIRAGFKEKTAYSQGQRLLKNVEVQRAIQEKTQQKAEQCELNAQWVLERLKTEADSHADDASAASRIRATELIGKHLAMFTDVTESRLSRQMIIVEEIVDVGSSNQVDQAAQSPEVISPE